ncbi:hypothetical protein [Ramlibacter sp. AN1133]|uniref:hypothetical protein n=1 Tax=Ramlibacter sp. AN1133 TaxID=3133429 RepID=UPI0030BA50AD
MTKSQNTFLVNARPLVRVRELRLDDRSVRGVHLVGVNVTVAEKSRAEAALDVFHSTVPVKVLDDFEFSVVDPASGRVLPRDHDHESYSLSEEGEYLEQAETRPLKVGRLLVRAVGGTGENFDVGSVTVAGTNRSDLEHKAVDLLWDDRLRSTGYSPRCEAVGAESDDDEVDEEQPAAARERQ